MPFVVIWASVPDLPLRVARCVRSIETVGVAPPRGGTGDEGQAAGLRDLSFRWFIAHVALDGPRS
jgi:hypothetical protein